jgi:Na+-transporting NADH:ubiquinone oxidoreductase subunit B
MDILRETLDKIGAQFAKGTKLEPLHALYEAPDTILYTPGEVTKGLTHVRDGIDQKRMMITVVFALIPCVLWAMYNTGWQVANAVGHGAAPWAGWQTWLFEAMGFAYDAGNPLNCMILGALYFFPVFIVTGVVGGNVEVIFALARRHEITEGFLVTWFLFALIVPPTIPLWQVALGITFGVFVGKEVFGGVGMNVLNPALTGRAFLFFAYPAEISGDKVWTAAIADPTTAASVDGWSGATWLGRAAEGGQEALNAQSNLWWDAFIGYVPGSMGETSVVACLIGAVILIVTRVGSWRTMAGVLIGTVVTAGLMNALHAGGMVSSPMYSIAPHWHLVLGGWAFGAVFMATDPVSSAFTDTGKWFYGLGIGLMVILVRVVNPAYPEGMMLAILFMNMFAPLFDHFVVQANVKRRRVRYGEG